MSKSSDTFSKAINNFTMDVAAGAAIRHLADIGYGPEKIQKTLTYPAPMDYISKTVYEHLLNLNIIVLKDPATIQPAAPYEFILETNEYGKTSYRRVEKKIDETERTDYICVSFGSDKYRHSDLIEANRNLFSPQAYDYLMNIPWPVGEFWHEKNERVDEIASVLSDLLGTVNRNIPS